VEMKGEMNTKIDAVAETMAQILAKLNEISK
jgi:hypothetical protein